MKVIKFDLNSRVWKNWKIAYANRPELFDEYGIKEIEMVPTNAVRFKFTNAMYRSLFLIRFRN